LGTEIRDDEIALSEKLEPSIFLIF